MLPMARYPRAEDATTYHADTSTRAASELLEKGPRRATIIAVWRGEMELD
jgi:hypothetical protein